MECDRLNKKKCACVRPVEYRLHIIADHLSENPPTLAWHRSRVQLTWLALHRHVKRPSRNCRNVHAWEACVGLTYPCEFILSTKSLGSVVDDLRSGRETCGFSGDVLALTLAVASTLGKVSFATARVTRHRGRLGSILPSWLWHGA